MTDRVKSIFIVVGFVLVGLAILHGLAFISNAVAPDSTLTFFKIDKNNFQNVLDHKEEVEAVVLGNSHGDDLNFKATGIKGYSLARAWGDFYETNYYLEYLVPRLPNLKIVFIPVAYFSFDWNNAYLKKLSVRRVHMYSIIPSWKALPGDLKNFVTGRGNVYFPFRAILREDNWRGIFFKPLTPIQPVTDVAAATSPNQNCEYMDAARISSAAKKRADEQIRFIEEIRLNHPDVREDTYQIAAKTIEYLQERDIQVVFFTPPYYSEYTEYFQKNDPGRVDGMRSLMNKLIGEYGITYIDFSENDQFINNNMLFKDSDHLNSCGSELFSNELIGLMD